MQAEGETRKSGRCKKKDPAVFLGLRTRTRRNIK
jgi:hypothetical protein